MAEPSDFVDSDPDFFDPQVVERLEEQDEAFVDTAAARVRDMLVRRKQAYAAVFTEGNRTQADIDIVLADLGFFCKQWTTPFSLRDGIHADTLMKMKEGRREVFQRIKDFSLLDGDTLFIKYTEAATK